MDANKAALRAYTESLRYPGAGSDRAAEAFFAPDARINMVHPFNELAGSGAFTQRFLTPLAASFDSLTRTDYIGFGGNYEGADWVTCTGYYTGHFARDWLGIRATGRMAHLRFGEFHRMEGGRAVESYIFLDLPELMIACDQWPISQSPGRHRGFTGYLAGPITQDGLQWQDNDRARGAESAAMVTTMLRGLATPDEKWRPYWHERMIWYGPAAFGSFIGLEEFAGFQVPFEQTFSEWIGGSVPGSETRHFTRFGDGDYVCSGGWPSLNAVQAKPFLGQPSEGKRLYMRVCDWWRREGDLLVENWVFVDIPHVLLQMGVDLFENVDI
ncbi:nuclear transport factor 2 family protein [Primorskyibacter aestuariivivens]|uniref:nuclear transport factor 2 family protein n=1 Tax=Primorskyibacter aestuariivivens TaxID=1888912 RepID=UPI00230057FF|nr:nuclear transport factor 2 family protein [Primorskyibacter aestuariivivens]MDA7426849.1 nuclear transport factor 2 family protein [Primorskyibacter aestuariivivens]